jgi:hypothetical protein
MGARTVCLTQWCLAKKYPLYVSPAFPIRINRQFAVSCVFNHRQAVLDGKVSAAPFEAGYCCD